MPVLTSLQQLAPASLGSGLMSQHQQAALLQAAAQGGPLPMLPLTTPTTSDPPLSSIDTIAPLQHTFQVHTKTVQTVAAAHMMLAIVSS